MRSWVLIAVLLLFVPATSAVPVTLYAHDIGMYMPLNTQEPDERYAAVPNLGMAMASACIKDPVGAQHFTDRSHHTWYAVSTAAGVEYDVDENGQPRIHMERGVFADIHLNGSTMLLHWYLAMESPTERGIPLAYNMVLRATMREGDDLSVGDADLNAGTVIAQGQSQAVTLSPVVDHPQVSYHMVGDTHVYGFHIPLAIAASTINATASYNLRIDAFMDNPLCSDPQAGDGDYLNPYNMRVFQSKGLWNRLETDVEEPLSLDNFHIASLGNEVAIHLRASSVFGSYDIPVRQWLTLDGGADPAFTLDSHRYDSGAGYFSHAKPQEQSYLWAWQNMEPGVYPFTFSVENLQGTANLTRTGELRIADSGPSICFDGYCLVPSKAEDTSVPGFPIAGGLIALVAIAVARRR